MQLELLGTGGYHPNEFRHTASFLLPQQQVAFDAGTALFRLPAAVTSKQLHLFLTHPHWDHILGLTYLLVPMMLGQLEQVTVYGNRFTLDAVRTHLFAAPTFSHMPPFELRELEDYPDGVSLPDCHIAWQPLPSHPGGSVAFRLTTGDLSFAYVTDTFVDGSYHEFIHGADLLLHECYFPDDMQDWAEKTGHSYLSQVCRLAAETRVSQLLLTHMDPRINQPAPFDLTLAHKLFPPTDFAHDRTTHTINAT